MQDGSVPDGLAAWGWTEALAHTFAEHAATGRQPGRVVGASLDRYRVRLADSEVMAAPAGRLRHAARQGVVMATVGDWVAVETGPRASEPGSDGICRIAAVLPRRTAITRQAGSELLAGRVLAANVDLLLIVQAAGHDTNLRRLERYLAMAWSSGAEPAVVINKADLLADPGPVLDQVRSTALGVTLHLVSATSGLGLEGLRAELEAGRTLAFVGSSGVGKSTLINALLGFERQATAAVREGDQRGRHTTVERELIRVPGGGQLLDTPGMRALAPWEASDGLAATFADIETLAAGCRFADCRHADEPGCAVSAAIARGELDEARLASRDKLERELAAQARRSDAHLRETERRRWKGIERDLRARERLRRGWSG